jgi:urease accessory protein
MKKPALLFVALLTLSASVPSVAFAHTGIGGTAGPSHGFLHPITGLDHVLAMVMVGVLAWQLGGRALWLEVVEIAPCYDTSDITSLLGTRVVVDTLGSLVAHGKLGSQKAIIDKPVSY